MKYFIDLTLDSFSSVFNILIIKGPKSKVVNGAKQAKEKFDCVLVENSL